MKRTICALRTAWGSRVRLGLGLGNRLESRLAVFAALGDFRADGFGVAIGEGAVAFFVVADGNLISAGNPASVVNDRTGAADIRTFAAFMGNLFLDQHELARRIPNARRLEIKRGGIG